MFASTISMQLLAVMTLLVTNIFGNPIKRSNDEATGVRINGLYGLFTTIPTSALTTGELVGVAILSSQTIYLQEPNYFPATTWGIPEVTPSSVNTVWPITSTATSGNTPYSFPTPTLTIPALQYNRSISLDSCTEAAVSTPAPIVTPVVQKQAAVTTSSCNTAVAGVTIPVSALTTGEFVAVEVLCGVTIYIKEPNFYPTKTYYGIPASSTLTTSLVAPTTCNTAVAGVTIPASALTTGEFVAVEVLCGVTIYIKEPNFYPTKTYYGISAPVTETSYSAASTTPVAVEPRSLIKPFFGQTKPTSYHQADRDQVERVPRGVAGNRGAKAFKSKGGMKVGGF